MADPRATMGEEPYGTTDLASSIYPEIDSIILAGPNFSFCNLNRTAGSKAPVAQMFHQARPPNLKLIPNFWYPPGDQYGDQYALTPIEEEGHYAEELALTPVRKGQRHLPHRRQKRSKAKMHRSYDYAEELALSPVLKKRRKLPCRPQEKSGATGKVEYAGMAGLAEYPRRKEHSELSIRGRKQYQPNMDDTFDPITVESPEEEQEEGASQELAHHVNHEQPEDLPVVKPTRIRKRKMDEEAKPARRSVRSRNVIISYAA